MSTHTWEDERKEISSRTKRRNETREEKRRNEISTATNAIDKALAQRTSNSNRLGEGEKRWEDERRRENTPSTVCLFSLSLSLSLSLSIHGKQCMYSYSFFGTHIRHRHRRKKHSIALNERLGKAIVSSFAYILFLLISFVVFLRAREGVVRCCCCCVLSLVFEEKMPTPPRPRWIFLFSRIFYLLLYMYRSREKRDAYQLFI